MAFSKGPTLANPAEVGLLRCSLVASRPLFRAKARYRIEFQKTFLTGWHVPDTIRDVFSNPHNTQRWRIIRLWK